MSNCVDCGDTLAFHPGYYLKEFLDNSGISEEEFAKKSELNRETVSLLIKGETPVNLEIATKLSKAIGSSKKFWINIQAIYDKKIASRKLEIEKEEDLEK